MGDSTHSKPQRCGAPAAPGRTNLQQWNGHRSTRVHDGRQNGLGPARFAKGLCHLRQQHAAQAPVPGHREHTGVRRVVTRVHCGVVLDHRSRDGPREAKGLAATRARAVGLDPAGPGGWCEPGGRAGEGGLKDRQHHGNIMQLQHGVKRERTPRKSGKSDNGAAGVTEEGKGV